MKDEILRKARIAILLPAYNEERTIAETIEDYHKIFPNAQFLVIDNNSTDRTTVIAQEALDRIDAKYPVIFEARQGKGYAVRVGLRQIDADYYILADADTTYPGEDAAKLLEKAMEHNVDMVVGDRVSQGTYDKGEARPLHGFGNRVITRVVSFVSGHEYKDVLSGLRILSRPFVDAIDLRSEGFQIETEFSVLAPLVDANIEEYPISYKDRPPGSASKLGTFRDGWRIILFALNSIRCFKPAVFYGFLSVALAIASLSFGSLVIQEWFQLGNVIHPARAVLAASIGILATITFFTGLILSAISESRITIMRNRFASQKRIKL